LRKYLLVTAIALAVVALDQASKVIAIANLTPRVSTSFIGSLLSWYLTYNDSAAFSIGYGQTWIFAIIGSIALIALYWYLRKLEGTSWLWLAGLAAGGIAGNLFDRLFRSPGFGRGLVVDFIQIPFNFPIFNLADSVIVCVGATVVIRLFLGHSIGKK
jgi:signal peptidase II